MQVEEIAISREKAKQELDALKTLFKSHAKIKKDAIYADMKKVYGHMHHGGKVIDIYSIFNTDQLKENGDLKIAICRADARKCYLYKGENGSAVFSHKPFTGWQPTARTTYKDIQLPPGSIEWHKTKWNRVKNDKQKTIVPIVPPHILVEELKRSLGSYCILWEVEDWKIEPPRDPILLKKLTANLYGVLATWDLTELERAIIKANIE